MSLKDKINNDLKAALLSGDRFKGEVLRSIKAVILNEEVAKGAREIGLDDENIEKLLVTEVKKRSESADLYEKAGRDELAKDEHKEAEIISAYLPQQLSEAEIESVVEQAISELGATDPSALGKVIGAVKTKLGNTASGAVIAKIAKNALK